MINDDTPTYTNGWAMTQEYRLVIHYNTHILFVDGATIEGVRDRANRLYPGHKEIRIDSKGEKHENK